MAGEGTDRSDAGRFWDPWENEPVSSSDRFPFCQRDKFSKLPEAKDYTNHRLGSRASSLLGNAPIPKEVANWNPSLVRGHRQVESGRHFWNDWHGCARSFELSPATQWQKMGTMFWGYIRRRKKPKQEEKGSKVTGLSSSDKSEIGKSGVKSNGR